MLGQISLSGSFLSLPPQEASHIKASLVVGSFVTLLGAMIGSGIGSWAFDNRERRSCCDVLDCRIGLDRCAKLENKTYLGSGSFRLEYSFSTPEKKREYEEYMKTHRNDLVNYLERTKNDRLRYIKIGALAGTILGIATALTATIDHWPTN